MHLEGTPTCPEAPIAEAIPEAIVIESAEAGDQVDTERLACHREAWLHPVTLVKSDPWHAIVVAISTSGISLAIERRVATGTFFAVELPDPLGGVSRTYAARVIHTEPEGHGYWQLGCAFATELTEEELLALV
ncbi:hypothetical protein AYO44_07755 [Planctomycetaceae bacterium SCGC AG-212-F19]|nr:hypothetical protein AYO44_07755 [Planctomycetaceae bacterium SCGC AG-212-F19]